ncbi:8268_t:CDS:2, partial [Gigaspora margarita]
TFNLNDGTSETLQLDAPDVILIKKENFVKFLNIVEPNKKTQITIDVDEDYEVNQESRTSDSVYDITDQETNIESSFEMSEKGSTNLIEKAEFSHVDDEPDSTLQPSSIKENAISSEMQVAVSDFQEPLQNNGSHSDEYSDTEEEIDKLLFDSLDSSSEKRNRVPSDLTNDSLPSISEVLVT